MCNGHEYLVSRLAFALMVGKGHPTSVYETFSLTTRKRSNFLRCQLPLSPSILIPMLSPVWALCELKSGELVCIFVLRHSVVFVIIWSHLNVVRLFGASVEPWLHMRRPCHQLPRVFSAIPLSKSAFICPEARYTKMTQQKSSSVGEKVKKCDYFGLLWISFAWYIFLMHTWFMGWGRFYI